MKRALPWWLVGLWVCGGDGGFIIIKEMDVLFLVLVLRGDQCV